MSDGQAPNFVYLALCLVLVASALFSRRLPLGQTAKMAAAWIGIFALVFALFSFRSEFMAIGSRASRRSRVRCWYSCTARASGS